MTADFSVDIFHLKIPVKEEMKYSHEVSAGEMRGLFSVARTSNLEMSSLSVWVPEVTAPVEPLGKLYLQADQSSNQP